MRRRSCLVAPLSFLEVAGPVANRLDPVCVDELASDAIVGPRGSSQVEAIEGGGRAFESLVRYGRVPPVDTCRGHRAERDLLRHAEEQRNDDHHDRCEPEFRRRADRARLSLSRWPCTGVASV